MKIKDYNKEWYSLVNETNNEQYISYTYPLYFTKHYT